MADSAEAVFCHQCRHEWSRSTDGLVCPRCQSEFTEIIERDNDPREAAEEDEDPFAVLSGEAGGFPSFERHNPWAEEGAENDGLESHMTRTTLPGGGVSFTWSSYRSNTPSRTRDPSGGERPAPTVDTGGGGRRGGGGAGERGATPDESRGRDGQPRSPIFQDFHRMIMEMTNPQERNAMPRTSPMPSSRPRSASPFRSPPQADNPRRDRENGLLDVSIGFDAPPRPSPRQGGGRYAFNSTERLWPRDANRPQPSEQIVGELQGLLSILAQNMAAIPGAIPRSVIDDPPEGSNPLAAVFTTLLNPDAAASGDAVYSQEALDRVISNLMEQNPNSNAPGPASEAAISALPRKNVDKTMLGEEGKAECSVCMDDVQLGEEVISLPCHHWFHEPCARLWLQEHDTCPICRTGIMPKEGDGDRPRTPRQEPMNSNPWASGAPPQPTTPGPSNSTHLSPNDQQGHQQPSTSPVGRRQSRSEDERAGSSHSANENGGIGGRVRGWFSSSNQSQH